MIRHDANVVYTERDVFSSDEVVVRAWTNGAESGAPVLICNGLAAPAECWPGLYDDDSSGLRVVSYFHRGTSGSGRPLDESATYLSDHAADGLAVLDAYDIDRAVVVGWSVGVPVAFEIAHQAPERVSALLAVSGIPKGQEGLRRFLSQINGAVASGAFQAARALPPALLDLMGQIPVNSATMSLLRFSGLIAPDTDPELMAAALRKYLEHDPAWYLRLAEQAARTASVDTSHMRCPVAFLSGRGDPVVPWQAVVDVAAQIPGASAQIVPGSHFLPLESPALVREALVELITHTVPDTAQNGA